jgi:hypothetical protein
VKFVPFFELIVIPIPSITSMTTNERTSAPESIAQVHFELTLPPFAVLRDCRSFGTFIESIEFLRLGNLPNFSSAHREIQEVNGELNNAIELLKSTKPSTRKSDSGIAAITFFRHPIMVLGSIQAGLK